MEERNIKVSLEKAKEWYRGNDSSLRELALQVFTKEELEKKELPKTWEEWVKQNEDNNVEWYIDDNSQIQKTEIRCFGCFRGSTVDANLLKSKEQAEAVLALIKLIRLRDAYRQGWKPNWKCENTSQYCIDMEKLAVIVYFNTECHTLFSFPTIKLAEQFLENFKEDLKKLKELL